MAKKPTKTKSQAKGKPEERAIAKAPTQAVERVQQPLPGRGFENLAREDILLPRISLLQPLSPEVTGDLEQDAGTLYVKLSNKNLGKTIQIVPILHFRSRIKWIPRDEGGGIDCSAADARIPRETKYSQNCFSCAFKDWDNEAEKKKDQQPKCVMYENFLVLVGDGTEPILLPMEKSKAKAAKKFYSMASLKGGDMWSHVYSLSVTKEKGPNDESFYNYSVSDIGKPSTAKQRELCEGFWASLVKKDLTKSFSHPDEESGPKTAVPAGEGKY